MEIRELTRHEVSNIWQIDRAEIVKKVYHMRAGELVLENEFYNITGWPPGESEMYNPILLDCFDRGGTFCGAFVDEEMVGIAVLENRFIGRDGDQLQLTFLHVGRAYRNSGLGKTLFRMMVEKARSLSAKKLYVSSTPSENTVRFYLKLGCTLSPDIDPELFEREPDDIHLEYLIPDKTR
jgi:predicted N-acetyltransferase YhbS